MTLCPSCDLLTDVRLEESVLSSMISGAKVTSLPVEAFTSELRQKIYLLLRAGVPYENLEAELRRDGLADEGYLADIYLTPLLPHRSLKEGVEELRRLSMVRPLHGALERWLTLMPTMTYEKAISDLLRTLREVRIPPHGSNGASGPSPK